MLFVYQTNLSDLLHFGSYLMVFLGAYGFAVFVSEDISNNLKKVFQAFLIVFFLGLLTEHIFAFLGFENADYWNFKIYDVQSYANGNPAGTLNTFGNLGSGKGTVAFILLAICSVSYLFEKGVIKYFLIFIILYLGLMTYSRAFLLALVVYAIFEALNTNSRRKYIYFGGIFLFAFYVLVFNYDLVNIFVRINFGNQQSLGNPISIDPRVQLLFMQIQAISDNFIFGHGWSGMNTYFYEKFNRTTSGELGLISFFTEQGFIRVIYIYSIIALSIYSTIKFLMSKNNLFKEVYIASLMMLTFNFFWGATLVSNSRTFLMWFFIMLVIVIDKKINESSSQDSKNVYTGH